MALTLRERQVRETIVDLETAIPLINYRAGEEVPVFWWERACQWLLEQVSLVYALANGIEWPQEAVERSGRNGR